MAWWPVTVIRASVLKRSQLKNASLGLQGSKNSCVQWSVSGGQFDFACPPARAVRHTPHVGPQHVDDSTKPRQPPTWGYFIARSRARTGAGRRRGGTKTCAAGLLTKAGGKPFRVGIFLDFASSSTRTMHPHGGASYVRMSGRTRIGPHWGVIEHANARRAPLSQTGVSDSTRETTVPGLLTE